MPASGTSAASLCSSGQVRRSHWLLSSTAILDVMSGGQESGLSPRKPTATHLRRPMAMCTRYRSRRAYVWQQLSRQYLCALPAALRRLVRSRRRCIASQPPISGRGQAGLTQEQQLSASCIISSTEAYYQDVSVRGGLVLCLNGAVLQQEKVASYLGLRLTHPF